MIIVKYKILALILATAGLILSAYLYYTTTNQQELGYCDINKILSCTSVENSIYSKLFGIPLPLLAIAWFTLVLLFTLFERLSIVEFLVFVAIIFVAYLVFTEVVLIGSICILCTITQILGLSIIYPIRKMRRRISK